MPNALYERDVPRRWRARDGAGFNDEQAQKIGERIEYLAARTGATYVELTTDQIYEDAQSAESPLHVNLEWRDTVAAERWRKHQIRNVLNHLDIEAKDAKGNIVRYKAFFNVSMRDPAPSAEAESANVDISKPEQNGDDEETMGHRVYVDTEGLAANKEYRRDFAAYCKKKLDHWAAMVEGYGLAKNFARILRAIEEYEQEQGE